MNDANLQTDLYCWLATFRSLVRELDIHGVKVKSATLNEGVYVLEQWAQRQK